MRLMGCLVLVLVSGMGCVAIPFVKPDKPKADKAVRPTKAERAPAQVTPEQVNEVNAPQKAEALRKELDREAQEETPETEPAKKQK